MGIKEEMGRVRSTLTLLLLLAMASIVAAGCSGNDRKNKLRAPAPLIVSVAIGDERVTTSPASIGAGPATFTVINLSSSAQRFTISRGDFKRSSRNFAPQNTTIVKVNLKQGEYELSAADTLAIASKRFKVTKERPSSQNDLLLP